jgi:hypothetical protein
VVRPLACRGSGVAPRILEFSRIALILGEVRQHWDKANPRQVPHSHHCRGFSGSSCLPEAWVGGAGTKVLTCR